MAPASVLLPEPCNPEIPSRNGPEADAMRVA